MPGAIMFSNLGTYEQVRRSLGQVRRWISENADHRKYGPCACHAFWLRRCRSVTHARLASLQLISLPGECKCTLAWLSQSVTPSPRVSLTLWSSLVGPCGSTDLASISEGGTLKDTVMQNVSVILHSDYFYWEWLPSVSCHCIFFHMLFLKEKVWAWLT